MQPNQYLDIQWCFWKVSAGILVVLDVVLMIIALAIVLHYLFERYKGYSKVRDSLPASENAYIGDCKKGRQCNYGKLELVCETPSTIEKTTDEAV